MRFCCILVLLFNFTASGQVTKPLIRIYGIGEGLSSSSVKDLVQDKEGFLWIATQTGLNRFDGVEFKQYYYQPGKSGTLPSSQVNRLQLSPDGQLIIFTSKGILKQKSDGQFIPLLPDKVTNEIQPEQLCFLDSQNLLIYGKAELYSYNSVTQTTKSVLKNIAVTCLIPGGNNICWICTDNGLIKLNAKTGQLIKHIATPPTPPNLPRREDCRLGAFDKDGHLWISIWNSGVFCLDTATGNYLDYYYRPGSSLQVPGYIAAAKDGGIWITNNSAIIHYQWKSQTFEVTDYEGFYGNGPPLTSIYQPFEDRDGQLWLASSVGIIKFSPHLQNKTTGFAIVRNTTDIYFNTIRLPIGNVEVSPDSNLILEPNQNNLSILFGCIGYDQGEKTRYHYRLSGKEGQWIDNGTNRMVTFANLNAGTYNFELRAIDYTGRLTKIITYHFKIKEYFYTTWWFYVLTALVLSLIGYLFFRNRLTRIKDEYSLRERIARDLHDEIGSTLTSVSILSKVARSKNDTDAKELLQKIEAQSQQASQSINDMVWNLKPENESATQLGARMKMYASELLEASSIPFTIHFTGLKNSVKLSPGLRQNVYLIFKEAVNNAAKYSNATNVDITLTMDKKHMVLTITDNGIGFIPDTTKGNGLGNMKKRAEILKANFEIGTSLGNGCTIKLESPIN